MTALGRTFTLSDKHRDSTSLEETGVEVLDVRLPLDCPVDYHAAFLTKEESAALFAHLSSSYDLCSKSVPMADGSVFESEHGLFMFADPELTGFDSLHEVWGERAPWSDQLKAVKDRIEKVAGRRYRVCRCLRYENGNEGVAFHADLPAYGDTNSIASLSLGAERRFVLRRKDRPDEAHSLVLEDGSLLIMGEGCQDLYEHALPVDPSCHEPRLNLTFRHYGWD